jgi:hypothetical protein
MEKKKRTPEERAKIRAMLEEGKGARAELAAAHARLQARWRAEDERLERRRRRLRRLLPFRRAL